MSTALLILGLLYTTPIQVASPTDLPFRSLTPDKGFPTTAVHHVMQDRHGFIWLSTRHGVYRYDGERYRAFKQDPTHANSLSANTVWISVEDRRGWIWMGTLGGGLTVYQPTRGRFHRFGPDTSDAASLPHHTVTALHKDEQGRMWVGTDGGGLSRARVDASDDTLRLRFHTYRHDAGTPQSLGRNKVLDITEDEHGHLWLATYGGGVSRFNPDRETFMHYVHRPDDTASLSNDYVMSVSLDAYGNLWAGTKYGGLNYLETRTGRVHRIPITAGESAVDFVWRTRVLDGSTLWVGTYGAGAFRIEYAWQADRAPRFVDTAWYRHDARNPYSLADDFVLSIFRDRTGVIWLGTDNNGASLHLDQQYVRPVYGRLPPHDVPIRRTRVTAYAVDRQGTRWLGTTEGLYWRPEETDAYRSFELPKASAFVQRIREDDDRTLWFSTNNGLYRYDPASDQRTDIYRQLREHGGPINDRFFDIAPVEGRTYWAATDAGLVAFTMRGSRVEEVRSLDAINRQFVSRRTRRLEVRGDTVWVGTTGGGMYVIDRRQQRVRSLAAIMGDSTYATVKVLDWTLDADGTMWVATYGAGIVRLRPDEEGQWSARAFTEEHGLPSNTVNALICDAEGRLWASTDEGLAGQEAPGGAPFRQVHLPVPGFRQTGRLFRGEAGTLLVAGAGRGMLRFNPRQYPSRTVTAPVAITQIRPTERPNATPTDDPYVSEVILSPGQRWMSVRASVLDFAWPSANRLRYRIDGFRHTWRHLDARGQLSVGDLSPGQYTLEVQGAGLHSEAGATPVRLAITVHPPIWQTEWFRGLAGLAVCGLLVGGYRYRVRQLRRVERMRRRIADDLHDDIGSKISSVALLLDAAQQNDSSPAPLVARAAAVAREVVGDLRDVVWIVDGEHDDLVALVGRMRLMAAQLFPETYVQFTTPDPMPDLSLDMNERRHLYLFYKEALNNAARHAQAEGLYVELSVEGQRLTLSVRDDGCGFDPKSVAPGRGMQTLRQRAEALGGTYRLAARPGGGTRIVLTFEIA